MLRVTFLTALLLAVLTPAASAHNTALPPLPGVTHIDYPRELAPAGLDDAAAARIAQTTPGLPQDWCGQPTTGNNPGSPVQAHVKVIYAYPADRPDRTVQLANTLQANIAVITRFVAAESGNTKTIRVDMGTSCGADYVDIQTMPLAMARDAYLGAGGVPSWSILFDEVRAKAGQLDTARNYLVYADGLSRGGINGVGGLYQGDLGPHWGSSDRPDADNVHNLGGQVALIYGQDGWTPPRGGGPYEPYVFLHEVAHNLGAVQFSAADSSSGGVPNSLYSHCNVEWDVMCYSDGGPAATRMTQQCDETGFPNMPEVFDCGKDSYFNPAPAPGSYLATHWNVYNSVFLAPCVETPRSCTGAPNPVELGATKPTPKAIPRPRRVNAALRWTRARKRHGKALTTLKTRAVYRAGGDVKLTAAARAFKLPTGRWKLKTCMRSVKAASASAGRDRCVTRTVRVGRRGRVRLPKLRRVVAGKRYWLVHAEVRSVRPRAARHASTLLRGRALALPGNPGR